MSDVINMVSDDSSMLSCDYPDELIDNIECSETRDEKIKYIALYIERTECGDVGDLSDCEVYVDDLIDYIDESEEYDCFDIKNRLDRIALCECSVSFVT